MRRWSDEAREHVRTILQAALNAVQPQVVLRRIVLEDGALHLPDGRRVALGGRAVRIAAVGKAAGMMAAHAQPWGPFADALVCAPHIVDLPGFESHVGAHPLPDDASVRAGERVLEMAAATRQDDLFILLLSGGASAMCEAPEVPLADLRATTRALLLHGAPIEEINLVRRHLSRLKGGGLARACQGELLVLAISDVDDAATLGSGPTVVDRSTPQQALAALEARGLAEALPASIREILARPAPAPHPGAAVHVLADNDTALHAAADAAERLGYVTRTLPRWLEGEARERGQEFASLARTPVADALAVLAGGETTVHVIGHGTGGRNQEFALSAVDILSGQEAILAAMGTDGVDGPTDAAGALVDGSTRARGDALGLDAHAMLVENDSHPYFDALDDLIRTGPTGTNVRDLAVLLVRALPGPDGEQGAFAP